MADVTPLASLTDHDETYRGHNIHVEFNMRTRTWMWWVYMMQRVDGEASTKTQAIRDARKTIEQHS